MNMNNLESLMRFHEALISVVEDHLRKYMKYYEIDHNLKLITVVVNEKTIEAVYRWVDEYDYHDTEPIILATIKLKHILNPSLLDGKIEAMRKAETKKMYEEKQRRIQQEARDEKFQKSVLEAKKIEAIRLLEEMGYTIE